MNRTPYDLIFTEPLRKEKYTVTKPGSTQDCWCAGTSFPGFVTGIKMYAVVQIVVLTK